MQHKDIQRALFGLGNYDLAHHMSCHRFLVQKWSVMTPKERKNRIHRFITDCRVSQLHVHQSVSSDKLLIVKAAISSKKPSQKGGAKQRVVLVLRKIRASLIM